MVAPLELMATNPSTPHVAGMKLEMICQKPFTAYRGHVMPLRKRNRIDEKTTTGMQLSRSVTNCEMQQPKKTLEMRRGRMKVKICHKLPICGKLNHVGMIWRM